MVTTTQSTIVKEDILIGAKKDEAGHYLRANRTQRHDELNHLSEQQAQQDWIFLRGSVATQDNRISPIPPITANDDGGTIINSYQYRRHLVKLATGEEDDFNHTKWQLIWIGGLCLGCAWIVALIV